MSNIHKFIEYVVNNWPTILHEVSYGKDMLKRIIDGFKEDIETYGGEYNNITDEQLLKYIEAFDNFRKSGAIKKTDILQYDLPELIRVVTSKKQFKDEAEPDPTVSEVVYNDDNITVWSGARQEYCVRHGVDQPMKTGGSRWCITEPGGRYWGQYRYGESNGYPTFYLIKNRSLPKSDKLSFVAVQILQNGNYKYTNRANSPGMSSEMSWDRLIGEVPWLSEIPNLRNLIKWIPFTPEERRTKNVQTRKMSYESWLSIPISKRIDYLTVYGKDEKPFTDLSMDNFLSKKLPKEDLKDVAKEIVSTYGVISLNSLLSNLESFTPANQKSILYQLTNREEGQVRQKIQVNLLSSPDIDFSIKKLITAQDIWNKDEDTSIYLATDSKGQEAIVKLIIPPSGDISMSLYKDGYSFPSVALNKKTSLLLLAYPDIDKMPLKILLDLLSKGAINRGIIDKIIKKGEEDPNSAIIVKNTEDGRIVLDTNSFTAYKLVGDEISKITFDTPEVQQILAQELSNTGLQQNAFRLVSNEMDIPDYIDKIPFLSILLSIPPDQRIFAYRQDNLILIIAPEADMPIFGVPTNTVLIETYSSYTYGESGRDWKRYTGSGKLTDQAAWIAYFNYLRSKNLSYNDQQLREFLDSQTYGAVESKVSFVKANPPLSAGNQYRPFIITTDGTERPILLNTANSTDSLIVGKRGGLIRANIKSATAQQLLRANPLPDVPAGEEPAGPAAAAAMGAGQAIADPLRRRGRPAAGAQIRPVVQQPNAGAGVTINQNFEDFGQGAGLLTAFNALPNGLQNPFVLATPSLGLAGDRGATRRTNMLPGAGRVVRVLSSTTSPSKMYIIQLDSGLMIASIVIQPGNLHYIMRQNGPVIRLADPSALAAALQQNNLNEELMGAVTRLHIAHNPSIIKEKLKQKQNES
jgi:hypothetical protein